MEHKEIEIGKHKSLEYLGDLYYIKEKDGKYLAMNINKITLSDDFKDSINEFLYFLSTTESFYNEALKQNQDSDNKIAFFIRELARIERIARNIKNLL